MLRIRDVLGAQLLNRGSSSSSSSSIRRVRAWTRNNHNSNRLQQQIQQARCGLKLSRSPRRRRLARTPISRRRRIRTVSFPWSFSATRSSSRCSLSATATASRAIKRASTCATCFPAVGILSFHNSRRATDGHTELLQFRSVQGSTPERFQEDQLVAS